jgi:hypothetical protein
VYAGQLLADASTIDEAVTMPARLFRSNKTFALEKNFAAETQAGQYRRSTSTA